MNEFEDIKIVAKPIIESVPYYTGVRTFLEKYSNNKDLNILCTELVKCQNQFDNNKKKAPLDPTTEERCFDRFLKREIQIFSKYGRKPVLVLLGNRVFWFIWQHLKKNTIARKQFDPFWYLTLYHPTGSRKFNSYFHRKNIENNLKSRLPKKKRFSWLV